MYHRRAQMDNKRKYHIVIGSNAHFDSVVPDDVKNGDMLSFMELVKLSDLARQNKQPLIGCADKLIIRNNDYHGIVETAHDRLGALVEELTTDDAEIYVHNPPRVLKEFLEEKHRRKLIELDIDGEEYKIERDASMFIDKMNNISNKIIGQDRAIEEVSKSLWYLTNIDRKKPYVIMLFGNSSLGKTELVREIANNFYGGKFLEKHLSMFKNNSYSDYMFGDAPNRRSLGFDLLERESNLIFFDEVDKCPEHFYSAFYTLFDNVTFKDNTYDADVSGIVIILTSNFHSKDEIREQLGMPIFYRIDKFIHFDNFDCDTIYALVKNEIELREDEFKGKATIEMVYAMVAPLISVSGENARTIKLKVQQVIEELLFKEVLSNDNE